jgi:predicted phage terminase large subunit-like protein
MRFGRKPAELSEAEIAAAMTAAARVDFSLFAQVMHEAVFGERLDIAPFHGRLFEFLMRAFVGDLVRAIIGLPPRAGKTTLLLLFLAWAQGRAADAASIICSYGADLAERSSALLQRIIEHPTYQAIFPGVLVSRETTARDRWTTTVGGEIRACGIGGALTGFGAGRLRDDRRWGGCVLLDDPLKASDARSQLARDAVADFYFSTLRSRRNSPRTPIVLICQRLHEDDLAGRLLAGASGEPWEALTVAAMNEADESFWPRRFPVAELRALRDAQPWTYWTQFMQAPFNPAGQVFRVDCMPIFDEMPAGAVRRRIRAWDLAATSERPGADPDFTAGILVARYRPPIGDGDRFVIEDVVRLRAPPDGVRSAILKAAERDGPGVRVVIEEQPGAAGKEQIASLERMLREHQRLLDPVRATGSKFVRAEPCAAAVNVGNIGVLRRSWTNALLDELRAFDSGAHDDQVDALSAAFNALSAKVPMRISQEALDLFSTPRAYS